ncbi:hypothetical protein GOODEAATRI_021015 [Goodea atripinnis]|uniref:Uncharacterized protein n=1 Tax=Goodea atripinnis TaxID=208336 RepID=A0ABV0PFS8_9TELE
MSTEVLGRVNVLESVRNRGGLFSMTELKGEDSLPDRNLTQPDTCFQFLFGKGTINKLQNQFQPGKPRNHDAVVYRRTDEEVSGMRSNLNQMEKFTYFCIFLTIFLFMLSAVSHENIQIVPDFLRKSAEIFCFAEGQQ